MLYSNTVVSFLGYKRIILKSYICAVRLTKLIVGHVWIFMSLQLHTVCHGITIFYPGSIHLSLKSGKGKQSSNM